MNFSSLSPDDFEFLTEDILKLKGFTIISRPALGPDQGRDMIVERLVTDDMRITTREKYLVQCKHFIVSTKKSSVRESDIPNFTIRSKQHMANRYLLVTSGAVSETVKDLFNVINRDEHAGLKCAFFAKNDLIDYITPYPNLYEKYFNPSNQPLEEKAKNLLSFLKRHQFQVHRGAILYDRKTTAVFGNDGFVTEKMQNSLLQFRSFLETEKIHEITFVTCEENYSWVMLVDSPDARDLHAKIWECHPSDDDWKSYVIDEAFQRLWTHWDKPFIDSI